MASTGGRASPAFVAFATAGREAVSPSPAMATPSTGKHTLLAQLAAAPELFASPPPPAAPASASPPAVAKLGPLDVAGRRPATK